MDEIEIKIVDEDNLESTEPPLVEGRHEVWGNPRNASVQVLCHQTVVKAIQDHAKSSHAEIGGILIGDAFRYDGVLYIEIREYIKAPNVRARKGGRPQSSRVHFAFTPDIWAAMLRVKDHHFDHLRVVGWFHSHPGHGIFLSQGMDTQIQGEFFQQPWQTAMVYDPYKHEGGFFVWQNDHITRAPGFVELFDSEHNETIVSWRNYSKDFEIVPTTQGRGVSKLLVVAAFIVLFLILMVSILDLNETFNRGAASIHNQDRLATEFAAEFAATIELLATDQAQSNDDAQATLMAHDSQLQNNQIAILENEQSQRSWELAEWGSQLQVQNEVFATAMYSEMVNLNLTIVSMAEQHAALERLLEDNRADLLEVQTRLPVTPTPTITRINTPMSTLTLTPTFSPDSTPIVTLTSTPPNGATATP